MIARSNAKVSSEILCTAILDDGPVHMPYQQNVINPDGELRTDWSGLEWRLTPAELDVGFQLLQLGDVADKVLGMRDSVEDIPGNLEGIDQLRDVLQVSGPRVACWARLGYGATPGHGAWTWLHSVPGNQHNNNTQWACTRYL